MEDVKRWRRELHQIPELGLKEYETAKYLRHELEKMGYQWESIVDTGTIVYIDNGCLSTLAFRSDIDGLPIEEKKEVDYVSKHSGCMHASGHDGHMSAVLVCAQRLNIIKEPLNYNHLLLFQHADE